MTPLEAALAGFGLTAWLAVVLGSMVGTLASFVEDRPLRGLIFGAVCLAFLGGGMSMLIYEDSHRSKGCPEMTP